ncbi:DNA methyltransferase [Prescottella subtropica]|uniref:DNA methyltransferase n=1 Tax=Prescottella subtropica TaxID=2545757 RepID=UPI0010F7529D|nr:DNA methyltransferase [Prescottella subtropica]
MASFDSIVIGEDWISEHYFTTDSVKESFHGKVLELRKGWDAEKKAGRSTVRDDLLAATGDLRTTLAALAENPDAADDAHALTRSAFGYPAALSTFTAERAGSELEIPDAQLDGVTGALFLQAVPVASIEDLLDPETGRLITPAVEDGKPIESASKAVSAAFRSDAPPAFVVVQAGQWLLLAEAERWAEGRYLAVDLLVVAERRHEAKGGEIDRVAAMFGKQALQPDADGNIWWAGVLEDSVKHTVGVSKDLREGIRLSIEIIANEVVRRRATQGLTLDRIDGQDLAKHSLRFLYRILFLLYAEASPEMRVLPTGAAEYEEGYGLDRLRELTLTELVSEQSRTGTHLYESLATLFRLVDKGHTPAVRENVANDPAPGLEFQPLRADLFSPASTALIDEVGLGNEATQRILEHLLLSKESKGRKGAERGFISYAELGINQLGAVYEGLMSYTGFFAEEDLYEVAKNGDPEKGSWVVPVDRSDHLDEKDFVRTLDEATGEEKPVLHRKDTFVFRLAGRERQQSASYYTPEVLTKFVVSQALEELLDQDGTWTAPEQILELTICEPALGSGAFAIEAVRQLAAEYLKRQQEDLGELIDADQYPIELQKVKAHIALHQVYGVDLNATAVELAEISLWLDTMVAGLQAPWFGLHLRRGNSLIGARRSVYAPSLLTKKQWLKTPAKDVPLGEEIDAGIHHFLLPSDGWGAVIDTAEAKTYAPEKREELRLWRNEIRKSPSKAMVKRLQALAQRVETLWEFTLRRLTIAESEIRRDIDVWGLQHEEQPPVAVTREQIERALHDENGAYRRLRRALDAWCSLWFWPLTTDITPPDWDQWVGGLEAILGVPPKADKFEKLGQFSFSGDMDWEELDKAEDIDRVFAQALPIEKALDGFPWLTVAAGISDTQGFFHWELDFAPVFARGGFDLQVGNPPWVRPRSDINALLAEGDPWWQLAIKPTQEQVKATRDVTLALPGIRDLVLQGTVDVASTSAFVGSANEYPLLAGLQPDLYRCFMTLTWRNTKPTGSVGLIHLESHFTDEKAGSLRAETYRRLRRHWQFINELQLFEIQHQKRYGVNVYGDSRQPDFRQAASLYHPDTVTRSLEHDGSGTEPGIKDLDGNWDLRPHASRIVTVTPDTLKSWHAVLETEDIPVAETRMVYAVNKSTAAVLEKLAKAPRLSALDLQFSPGWHEKNDRTKGFFDSEWGVPESWDSVILQGSHLSVGRPLYKYPNESMLHNTDWTECDLEAIAPDEIPVTSYKPRGDRARYDAAYTHWKTEPEGLSISARDHYRLAWRNMAANTGERTFIPAIIPPGTAHIHGISSVGLPESDVTLTVVGGFATSLLHDFAVRVAPKSTISAATLDRLPFVDDDVLRPMILLRSLRLNCVTSAYSALWQSCFDPGFADDAWTTGGLHYEGRPKLGAVTSEWTPESPLRRPAARRQAMLELDVLVAIALRIEVDELCTIYRTQFPVLYGYDRRTRHYDTAGRLVPSDVMAQWRRQPAALRGEPLAFAHPCWRGCCEPLDSTHPDTQGFEPLDREADMRLAFRDLQERVVIRRSNSA